MDTGIIRIQAMNYVKGRIPIEATSIYDKNVSTSNIIIFLDSFIIHKKFSGILPSLADVGKIISYTNNGHDHLDIVKNYYRKRIGKGYVIAGKIDDIDIGFGVKKEKVGVNSIW